ncbi:MAG: hypothetical protein EBR71_12755, partial [Planctomycetes bacterium]|nr:hypothetical protein [Planctomycetota bacterium]
AEVIHTSVRRGLDGGTGFAVAARTGGMPRVLVESVSALSGLTEAWRGASDWDRTLRATRAVSMPAGVQWVASVIRPSGMDHTGRGNRLAHHRVLDADEVERCDPAQLLCDHERWMASFSGEPRELDVPAPLPGAQATSGAANAWKSAFGDAGVAAEMLERAFQSGVGAWIVLPAGVDRLQLLREMVALLPPANRWKRGWSTRPLRPSADPVPVICVVDEREPEVQKAPVNAAWMLRPRSGEAPRASEALLRRAREGAEPAAPKPVDPLRAATVSWAPPARLEAAAPARVTRSESPDLMSSAEAPEATNPIRVAMDARARGGWPTSSRAMNIVLWIGVAGLLGAAAWWLLRGPAA